MTGIINRSLSRRYNFQTNFNNNKKHLCPNNTHEAEFKCITDILNRVLMVACVFWQSANVSRTKRFVSFFCFGSLLVELNFCNSAPFEKLVHLKKKWKKISKRKKKIYYMQWVENQSRVN